MKKSTAIFGTIVMLILVVSFAVVFAACGETPDQRDYFIVSFSKNNLDPDGTEAVPNVVNIYGSPFNVGTLPKPPTRVGHVFLGWNDEEDGNGQEFIASTQVVGDITVYAQWDEGAVTVSKPGARTVAFPRNAPGDKLHALEEAFDYVGDEGNGDYTVTIYSDQSLSQQTLSGIGMNISLEAATGKNVTITRSGTGDFFVVEDGAKLTLGVGITLTRASGIGFGVNISNGTFSMEGGTISGFSVSGFTEANGAGINVGANGTFIMEGGTISGNTASGNGGGVYVFDTGTFTMWAGEISGNTGARGGGVYNRGSFTMNGGMISQNDISSASGYGGGVCNLGIFEMLAGEISYNEAVNGGGVYNDNTGKFTMMQGGNGAINSNIISGDGGGVYNLGEFTMWNGEISENKDVTNGGGVYNLGEFTMEAGTIGENEAASGGGVYNLLNFTMNGGDIRENHATGNGGGVNLPFDGYNLPVFAMTDGTISGNTAANGGGVSSSNEFTMDGGTISGNTASFNGGGVYVDDGTFSKTAGIIAGDDNVIPDLDGNEAVNGRGHAVYIDRSTKKIRDKTVEDDLESSSDDPNDWDDII